MRLFNSFRGRNGFDWTALIGVIAQPAWSVRDAQSAVQMLVHDHRTAGQCAAPVHLVDLQGHILKTDGVVASYGALELQRED